MAEPAFGKRMEFHRVCLEYEKSRALKAIRENQFSVALLAIAHATAHEEIIEELSSISSDEDG